MRNILILIGPSGSGKTTIARELLKSSEFELVQSITSRLPRETDAGDYRFVSREEFRRMIAQGAFLEWSSYKEEFYGTPKDSVEEIIQREKNALMVLDSNGAMAIKAIYHDQALVVALTRPEEAMRAAIDSRAIPEEEKNRRKANLTEEMDHDLEICDFAVFNKTVKEAAKEIRSHL